MNVGRTSIGVHYVLVELYVIYIVWETEHIYIRNIMKTSNLMIMSIDAGNKIN